MTNASQVGEPQKHQRPGERFEFNQLHLTYIEILIINDHDLHEVTVEVIRLYVKNYTVKVFR